MVDAVIAKGYIDEKNLFVTGGSGGGVLNAWMIGHTDRFRAALAFYTGDQLGELFSHR